MRGEVRAGRREGVGWQAAQAAQAARAAQAAQAAQAAEGPTQGRGARARAEERSCCCAR